MSDLASGNNGPGICMYVCVCGGWRRGRKVKVSVSLSLSLCSAQFRRLHRRTDGRTDADRKGEGATDRKDGGRRKAGDCIVVSVVSPPRVSG